METIAQSTNRSIIGEIWKFVPELTKEEKCAAVILAVLRTQEVFFWIHPNYISIPSNRPISFNLEIVDRLLRKVKSPSEKLGLALALLEDVIEELEENEKI